MNVSPHTTLLCPHCYREFRVAAWRINPGSTVGCTCCGGSISIDLDNPDHRQAMEGARGASELFQFRRSTLLPRQYSPQTQKMLDRLEHLAQQLDEIGRR